MTFETQFPAVNRQEFFVSRSMALMAIQATALIKWLMIAIGIADPHLIMTGKALFSQGFP
jgi:hypothetical protein